MVTQEKINRINELAKKKKNGTITEKEQEERKQLHREYINAIKGQVKDHLSRVKYVEDLTDEERKQLLNK